MTILAIANRELRKTARGFRLWETCTSRTGTPMSPIFATLDALCAWAADNATIWADRTLSAAEWKAALTGDDPAVITIR